MTTLSKDLINSLSKEAQKQGGIYFTPLEDVEVIVKKVLQHNPNIKTILEPSCGSCEFLRYLDNNSTNTLKMVGYETDPTIFKEIKQLKFKNDVKLYNKDFLKSKKNMYDLIIGNPPYYEIIYEEPNVYFNTSKINIYLLFIIECLEQLNKNGILAFVLPNSFLNNRYSNEFRKHITNKYKLLWVHTFDTNKYINTSQDTCVVVIQNAKPTDNNSTFSKLIYDTLIFNTKSNVKKLKQLMKNSKSLNDLGYTVNVGNVLWNENKDILTNDKKKTRLIYNTDIVNNKIQLSKYKNIDKKHFIDKEGSLGPVIVVNRGYGTSTYDFKFAILIPNKPYLLENHVLSISGEQKGNSELVKIIKSFEDERTLQFIKIVFTNNAINVHELKYMMPIYIF
jgi:type I restriction-modification system DNA methylase subunit